MKSLLRIAGYLIATLTIVASSSPTLAKGYTLTELGVGFASSINTEGLIVGTEYSDSAGVSRAVLWDPVNPSGATTKTYIGLGGVSDLAVTINDSGHVAGYSRPEDGTFHPWIWNGTTTSPIAGMETVSKINHGGQVYGSIVGGNPALWDGSTVRDLSLPGETFSYLNWLGYPDPGAPDLPGWELADGNNSGKVVGRSIVGDTSRPILWDGKSISELGSLDGDSGTYGAPGKINNSGVIIGTSMLDNTPVPVVWNGTVPTYIDDLLDESYRSAGWRVSWISDINDNGWIVGSARLDNGKDRAILLTLAPVPEPEIYAMLLAGLAVIVVASNRVRR